MIDDSEANGRAAMLSAMGLKLCQTCEVFHLKEECPACRGERKIPFLHPSAVARGVRLVRLLELAAVAGATVEFETIGARWQVTAKLGAKYQAHKLSGYAAELRAASDVVIDSLERLLRQESVEAEARVARLRAVGFDGSEEGGKTDAAAE